MDLAGKDFFTEDEAAHYACVSKSQFRRLRQQAGIAHFSFMGKNVYRRDDIKRVMDSVAQRQIGAVITPQI